MVNAMYIGSEFDFDLRGEIVFQSEEWTHLLAEGTDTIVVVPNEDVVPI